MSEPRQPAQPGRPARPARPPMPPRSRPDARPLRIAFGMGALATASALVTAMTGQAATPAASAIPPVAAGADATTPAVRHVIQYVHLKPGETAPPQATVKAAPTPKPRVVIVTTTRQSGAKP